MFDAVSIADFDFTLRTRLVFGCDAGDKAGTLAREIGGRRVFLVTDPGIVAAGHVERVEDALRGAGLEVRRFDRVRESPTAANVDACRAALGDWPADLLVGLGGGSSIDVAKGCNFVRAGGGRMEDYQGTGKARGEMLPLIAIPTTAGTGTEVQSFALIEQDGTRQKMACGDPAAAPRLAILDPALTVTQPTFVTACTGLDTLGHAVETAVTTRRGPVSTMFSTMAFELAEANLPRVLEDPDDLAARGHMLVAAAFAGIAIENSMLGAAHSMANPLTAHHELAHGQAVGMMLPIVVRYNAAVAENAALYAALARRAGLVAAAAPDGEAVAALIARIESLLDLAGMERSLAARRFSESTVDALAAEAARQWTAQFNPRRVTAESFRDLFAEACSPTG